MALPRPLILAVAGVALALISLMVVQRQRTVADAPPATERVQATPGSDKADKTPARDEPAARPDRADDGSRGASAARGRDGESPSRPTATRSEPAQAERGVPGPVARALSQGEVIALLFTLEGAADDSATRTALRSLETGADKSNVAVFSDSIGNVGRYSTLVGGLGISQVPSVVIVDARRQAQLLEGYVDAGTLRQYVADAQR